MNNYSQTLWWQNQFSWHFHKGDMGWLTLSTSPRLFYVLSLWLSSNFSVGCPSWSTALPLSSSTGNYQGDSQCGSFILPLSSCCFFLLPNMYGCFTFFSAGCQLLLGLHGIAPSALLYLFPKNSFLMIPSSFLWGVFLLDARLGDFWSVCSPTVWTKLTINSPPLKAQHMPYTLATSSTPTSALQAT